MSVKVKVEPECSCPEYEDLSPDSRMECRKQLDLEMKALEDKRKAFEDVDAVDPMARTLLVVGLHKNRMPVLADFVASFDELRHRRGRYEGVGMPVFTDFQVFHEKNWRFVDGRWKQVDESFIRTRGVKEARFLLDLPHFDLMVKESHGLSGYRVRFVPATQDDETRKTFNVIGGVVERLQVVREKIAAIEINRNDPYSPPVLSEKYVDVDEYRQLLDGWRRQRGAGLSLPNSVYGTLLGKRPVKLGELRDRLKALCDEEVDLLIQLRAFQTELPCIEF